MSNPTPEESDAIRESTIVMPRPTLWPMTLSLALAISATGVASGSIVFVLIGGLMLVVSLWKWFGELLSGTGYLRESLTSARPAPIASRPGTVEKHKPGMVGYRSQLPVKVYPISAGLKGGLAGGLVMPIPALAWGVLSGHGIWFPVNLLAGMVLPGIQNLAIHELEQFRPGVLAIGVVIHGTMSAVIGLVYGVLLPIMPARPRWQLIFGGLIIPTVWTGFSAGLMGIVNPILQEYVNWYWFALSQMVFGLAAATVVVRSEKVDVPPAGSGDSIQREGR
jgi:hypothetical protein